MKNKDAVEVLAALAQDSRLAILRMLLQHAPSGLSAGAIAEQLAIPSPTLSFHLKELSRAGLLRARQEGRFVFYATDIGRMNELIAFLTDNCCGGQSCGVTVRGPSCDTAKRGRGTASRRRTGPS